MRSLHMTRMAGTGARLLAAAALALALGAVEARADHVFTLSGVTFDDGGTASGTFTTDDTLKNLLDFDITTSPGTDIGFHYTSATVISTPTDLPFILVLETASLDHLMELTFTNLTATGSPITLGDNVSFEQGTTVNARRLVTGGEVIAAGAVPEPSSLMMGSVAALAGLAVCARRSRRA